MRRRNNASKIGLLDGVGAGSTDKLTRNQLALMVLNALEILVDRQ